MTFQELMNALPRSVSERFHDRLDRAVIEPGASRDDVLPTLQIITDDVLDSVQYEDPEKAILVEFVLHQLPKAALNALFPA